MSKAAPDPQSNMGKPEPRLDGRLKVTGEARYGSDFVVSNPAYAFLVTSPIAKGRIESMDLRTAKAVPGLLEIFNYENTGELKDIKYAKGGGGPTSSIQGFGPLIQYSGQIVALVVADTFEAAREAAHMVRVNYTSEPPSATFDSRGVSESAANEGLPQAGDAEQAYAAADVRLEAQYETPTQHHNPIELFATTCVWRDNQLTIYEPSQFVYGLKANAAKKMSLNIADVRAVSPYVGGAFGSKAQFSPRTGLVALAAKRLNRPVKLVATRDQGFTIQTYRAETRHRIRIGAERGGKITSFIHEGWEVTSRPDPYSVSGVEDSARLYGFATVKTGVTLVHADRNTPGFMRSPPVVPYIYALESAMDELAVKLNTDPVELRRINDSSVDATGKQWSSRTLMKCYDQAAERFGWANRSAQPGSMRDGDWLIGWGCASAVYPTHVGAAAARVRLMANGTANVQIAAHDLGTGAYTVIGQMAAESLGIPLSSVTVELGDSELPPAPVAGGSNTTASACSAVMKACQSIQARLIQPADDRTTVGSAGADHNELNLEDRFKSLGVGAIEEYAEYLPPGAKPDSMKNLYAGTPFLGGGSKGEKLMYATGAEFVEVRVHASTREIRVPRIVGAFAAGRLMNKEDTFVNPVGVKGIGELGNVGTAAAVANAVYHATGVRVRKLPIRLEKLLTT